MQTSPNAQAPANAFVLRGNRSGAMYFIALVTMLVGLTLSLAAMQAAVNYFREEMSRSRKAAAQDLAEAGVDYAYWQIHYNGQILPYSASVNLNNGSFQVSATDNGNQTPSSMLITSTGTYEGCSYTDKRVTLGLLPYHYAWCSNGPINNGHYLTSVTSTRGLRSNGNIMLNSDFNNVTTGIWAGGTITASGTATPQHPNSPPVYFPTIDYTYYDSIATQVYQQNVTVWWLNPSQNCVIVVDGNVTFYGLYYSHACTIVSTGNVDIKGSLLPWDSNSYLAIITTGNITVESGASTVEAVLYNHNSSNNATLNIQGWNTTIGAICSDSLQYGQNPTFLRNSAINLRIMRLLNLPGL